jgi:hypothetical protein
LLKINIITYKNVIAGKFSRTGIRKIPKVALLTNTYQVNLIQAIRVIIIWENCGCTKPNTSVSIFDNFIARNFSLKYLFRTIENSTGVNKII